MMVNFGSVDEETDNEAPVKTPDEPFEDGSEEKVRVDRRKLEQMLQVNGEGDGPSAEEFFTRVMLETSTHVSWPSKLKIGAKSKKDPHIKITGQVDNIKKAKEMVVAVLESKANRVTLKMDVSHTDHSHIIGRGGQSIKKVMEVTGCHIHFPDSNRGSASTEKSNQVSIAGQPEGVEKARTRIRELLPLVIIFEIPLNNAFLPMESLAPTLQNIGQRYDVTFAPKGRSQLGCLVVVVRGSQDNVRNIQEAMGILIKQLTGHFQIPNMVSLQFDIAPQHHVFVVGRSGYNVKHITERTGAKIEFPDPSVSSRKGTVNINGSLNAVILARGLLVNSLPMLLMFDLKEMEANSLEDGTGRLAKLQNKFDVTIQVKPKPKQTSKSVVIKSTEKNSKNMYLTRLEILGNPMDPFTTQHPPFTSLPRDSPEHPFPSIINPMQWCPSPISSPLSSPTPKSRESPATVRKTPSPPGFPPGFEPYDHHRESGNGDYRRPRTKSDYFPVPHADSMHSPGTSEHDFRQRRSSEPTPIGESWRDPRNMDNSIGLTPSLPGGTIVSTEQPFTFIEGTKNATGRMPFDSPVSSTPNLFQSLDQSMAHRFNRCLNLTPHEKFIDYEEQRDKANELMTKKVIQPQIRTPNNLLSGYYLSKSDGAFRKPLGENLDGHGITSLPEEQLQEPGEAPAVRQDFSKSVKVIPHYFRKGVTSPFFEQKNKQFVEPSIFHSKDLYELLKAYGVENFAETLERQEIDFATFLTLTKEDLKEAGVEPLGARKKMEHAIRAMKEIQVKAVENSFYNRVAQNYRVGHPLDFNSQSGRF